MSLPHSAGHGIFSGTNPYDGGSGPPPPPASGSVSGVTSNNTINEGATETFSVTTANIANGESVSWSINHGTTSAADFSATSGTATVNNNSASFNITATADSTTEGNETFTVTVTYTPTSSSSTTGTITVVDTSQSPPPPSTPSITSVTPENSTSTVEGNTRRFDVVTVNVPNGTSLNWTVNNVTTSSADWTTASGTVTINSNAGFFYAQSATDATNEGTEEYTVTVSGTVSSTFITKTTGSQYIVDAASPRIDSLSVSSSSVEEGNNLNVVVDTLDYPNGNKVFNWAVSHVSTVAQDFDSTSGTVIVNTSAGSGTGNFNVPIRADTVASEGSETFRVTVTDPATPSINAQTILVTIVDKTPRMVSLSGPTTVYEDGNTNTYTLTTANVPNGTVLDVTYNYGSGVTSADFDTITTGVITTTVNNNTASITFAVDEDETTEGDETFTITVDGNAAHPNDSGVSVPVSITSGTITIDDSSTEPSLSISSTPVQGNETNFATMTWTITAVGFNSGTTLNWSINHGGTSAADFTATSGTTTLSGSTASISITAVEDYVSESAETFTFTVSGTSAGGTFVSETSHTVTLYSTSQTPSISSVSGPSAINEGATGNFDITTINVPNGTQLTWQIQTTSGVAPPLSGSGLTADDFNSATISGTVTINSNTGTVTVGPVADQQTEGSEQFKLFVYGTAGPNNTSINGTSGNCTINDTSTTAAGMDSSFSITGGIQSESGQAGFVEAYIKYEIDHEPSNNRIKIESHRGGSQTQAIIVTDYVDYTGLSNITSIDVKYQVSAHGCIGTCYSGGAFGPLPTNDGFSTNTYYSVPNTGSGVRTFGWMAKVNPNLGNNSTAVDADDVQLTVRVIDSVAGTFTATSNQVTLDLNAQVGSQPQV